ALRALHSFPTRRSSDLGAPGQRADVGVHDGRIVAVGEVEDDGQETLDADGLIVAPGFVDPHTHYDAQLFWDPAASPSNVHGVTSDRKSTRLNSSHDQIS